MKIRNWSKALSDCPYCGKEAQMDYSPLCGGYFCVRCTNPLCQEKPSLWMPGIRVGWIIPFDVAKAWNEKVEEMKEEAEEWMLY